MYRSAGYHETKACMWMSEEVCKAEIILIYLEVLQLKNPVICPHHITLLNLNNS